MFCLVLSCRNLKNVLYYLAHAKAAIHSVAAKKGATERFVSRDAFSQNAHKQSAFDWFMARDHCIRMPASS